MAESVPTSAPTSAPTSVVVGIIYPTDWETRPRELLEADLQQLAALDPRIEVLEARYLETSELRGQRGADPTSDLRHLAPSLTQEQREAFARVEVVVAMDLPFDVGDLAPRLRWVQGMGAGVSQLASAGLADAGIRLTTAAGVNAVSISEFVIARLLQMWKRLPEIDAKASAHDWEPTYGREVAGPDARRRRPRRHRPRGGPPRSGAGHDRARPAALGPPGRRRPRRG